MLGYMVSFHYEQFSVKTGDSLGTGIYAIPTNNPEGEYVNWHGYKRDVESQELVKVMLTKFNVESLEDILS